MIIRLAYSGGLIILSVVLLGLDIYGMINGVVGWDRIIKSAIGIIVLGLMTAYLRRTMSKPPRELIRELNRLTKERRARMLHTDDAIIFVKRFPVPVVGAAIIGVVDKEMADDALRDLDVGHKATALTSDVYTIQGKGLISREMKSVEVTGTLDNPSFNIPTTRSGLAKAIVRVWWQGIRNMPFDMRSGVTRVTDNETRHLVQQLAAAQPLRLDDQE